MARPGGMAQASRKSAPLQANACLSFSPTLVAQWSNLPPPAGMDVREGVFGRAPAPAALQGGVRTQRTDGDPITLRDGPGERDTHASVGRSQERFWSSPKETA